MSKSPIRREGWKVTKAPSLSVI